jgi:hypothetical protein
MSKYTIIKDCSPYYIAFTHEGMSEYISFLKQAAMPKTLSSVSHPTFINYNISAKDTALAEEVVSRSLVSKDVPLRYGRVNIAFTGPNKRYHVHKDGHLNGGDSFSINYPIEVRDDLCITRWYDESIASQFPRSQEGYHTDRQLSMTKEDHLSLVPVQETIVQPDHAILFNTEIWHDWDNSESSNIRAILTLRQRIENGRNTVGTFFDARKIMFGF